MTEITLPDEKLREAPDLVFTLPNGVKVEMWEPDGAVLEKALSMIPKRKGGSSITAYALIALSCTFDGKKLRYEDIRSMKLRNLNVLMTKFNQVTGGLVPLGNEGGDQDSE